MRIALSLSIGTFIAAITPLVSYPPHLTAPTDYHWAHWAARQFLSGQDCYRIPPTPDYIPYPFTAALLAAPLAVFPLHLATALFNGGSAALLAYALTRPGVDRLTPYWRLLAFCSFPYCAAVRIAQWSPLLTAAMIIPALLPLNLAKPQYLLPNLPNLNRNNTVACIAVLACTLLLVPRWPMRWLQSLGPYSGYIPALVCPALLLALIRYRKPRARQLILLSLMPQQLVGYDCLPLWLLPDSRRSMLWYTAGTWVLLLLVLPQVPQPDGRLLAAIFYLPALVSIMLAPPLLQSVNTPETAG
jgi:hypothetical protein